MRFAYTPPEIWSCCPSMRRPPLTLIDASHQWALGRSPDGWIHFHASIHASVSVCLPMSSAAWTPWQLDSNTTPTSSFSLERRWSSRTFRYGYLVTTSPQLSDLPSAAPSLRLGHRLRAFPTPMVWRAVCTRPGNVFTATFWFAITSDSSFM